MSLNPCFLLGNNPWFVLLRNKLPAKLHWDNISFRYGVDNNSLNPLLKKTSKSKTFLIEWSSNEEIYNPSLERNQSNRESKQQCKYFQDRWLLLLFYYWLIFPEHRFVFRNLWQNEHNTRVKLRRKISCWCSEILEHQHWIPYVPGKQNMGETQPDFHSSFIC